jgi:hypothetical protein
VNKDIAHLAFRRAPEEPLAPGTAGRLKLPHGWLVLGSSSAAAVLLAVELVRTGGPDQPLYLLLRQKAESSRQ